MIMYRVASGFIFSTDQSAMSLDIKTEYTPRAVVRLIDIFDCLACEWAVKGE